MAVFVQFPKLELSPPGGRGHAIEVRYRGFGICNVFRQVIWSNTRASAQESSAEAPKRKVRSRVVPEYPPLAKQMNVSGKVKIEATVAADGRVVIEKIIGGSPLLINSAMEALKRWRYEPSSKDSIEIVEFEFNPQGN